MSKENIHCVPDSDTDEEEDNSTNSEVILSTPEEVRLYKKLRNLQLKVRRCKKRETKHYKTLEIAQNILSNKVYMELVENSTSTGKILKLLKNKSWARRKYNFNEQITSLSIYKQNEKAYQFLSKIFKLPEPKTLDNFVQKIVFMPGINKGLLKKLKKKARTMLAKSRLCVLPFDEFALQSLIKYSVVGDKIHPHEEVEGGSLKFASHVVVFMLKGLFENYIQPIVYAFSFGQTKAVELKQFIQNIIKEVRQSGFVVVATVCKQGINNQDAIHSLIEDTRREKLKSQEEHTLNTFCVGELEIIPLYDPPNLLKDLRNNLLDMPLLHENEEGKVCTFKWEQIQKLYTVNLETSGEYSLLYKLTEHHVVPEKINKLKVVFASHIFSQKVAVIMNFFSDQGLLPPEYKDTALLILLIDQLFDTMNGSPKKDFECNPLLGAAECSPRCPLRKKWKEAKQVFSKMELLNKNNIHGPTIKKCLWNIEGFQYICRKLAFKYGISSIWTGRLNQEPLEKFLYPSH